MLLGLVLITTALNALRLLTAITWRNALDVYMPPIRLFYIGASGGVWTAVGLFMLWSYRRRNRNVRALFVLATGLYAVWVWVDRLVIQTTPRASWQFALLTTVALLSFTAFVLLDSRNLAYFRKETYERKPESQ